MKKGFSLVELIVVIGIIGVLAGILIASFSGGNESARAAKCLSNLRNLAQACQTWGANANPSYPRYPGAGSLEYMEVDDNASVPTVKYDEYKGWISWNSRTAYKAAKAHCASASWMTSLYGADEEANRFCLTNGALWKYVGGNAGTYVCPKHTQVKTSSGKATNVKPVWSYLMNSYFGWDYSKGSQAVGDVRKVYGELRNADKILLFSEIPFSGIGGWLPNASATGTDGDCVLQFDGSQVTKYLSGTDRLNCRSGSETIGVNHQNGRNLFAHVAYADGHVEKLRIPFTGSPKKPQVDSSELRQLTAWLCVGLDISFDGKHYDKVDE